ncbi:MAG: hypothetical protein SFZ24_11805 [Planctomycetota bacterium]|nr:hypothetical protein [Planctomycetota bacterium]
MHYHPTNRPRPHAPPPAPRTPALFGASENPPSTNSALEFTGRAAEDDPAFIAAPMSQVADPTLDAARAPGPDAGAAESAAPPSLEEKLDSLLKEIDQGIAEAQVLMEEEAATARAAEPDADIAPPAAAEPAESSATAHEPADAASAELTPPASALEGAIEEAVSQAQNLLQTPEDPAPSAPGSAEPPAPEAAADLDASADPGPDAPTASTESTGQAARDVAAIDDVLSSTAHHLIETPESAAPAEPAADADPAAPADQPASSGTPPGTEPAADTAGEARAVSAPAPVPVIIAPAEAPAPAGVVAHAPRGTPRIAALCARILAWPLSHVPASVRDLVGWFALVTLFNAACVWLYLLLG